MSHTHLRCPADLIAAAPGLLGFVPTNSMVVYLLHDEPTKGIGVRCAARFDITVTTGQAADFPTVCNLRPGRFAAAILLAICEQRHDSHARHLLDALRDGLQHSGIPVLRRLYARDVTEPGQWLDADTGDYGDTYPYTDSVLTAQLVHAGTQIRRSRSDIESEFSPLPPAPPAEVGSHGELVTSTAEEIAAVLNGKPITSPTLHTRAGIVITGHPALRDAMIGLAIDQPQAGSDLWTHIGRRLRGQPRAEALTVAAACLCLAGDTVRAGIALAAALEEADTTHTPQPGLAVLLTAVLQAGIEPARIRAALRASAARPGGGDTAPRAD